MSKSGEGPRRQKHLFTRAAAERSHGIGPKVVDSLVDRAPAGRDNRRLMAKFRIDTLDNLARQLTFSPHDARVAQLAAAEDLLHTLDPAKAYPLDFVIFRVTGYHPKH